MFGVYFYEDLWPNLAVRKPEDPRNLIKTHLQIQHPHANQMLPVDVYDGSEV